MSLGDLGRGHSRGTGCGGVWGAGFLSGETGIKGGFELL